MTKAAPKKSTANTIATNTEKPKDNTTEAWPPLLLAWFARAARQMPWRTPGLRDPYRVWVSEIMLQQTKVETVGGYFLRWMERFPTIFALAEADEAEVLRYWQGLGYYSRARNLHVAAQTVVRDYGGNIPRERAQLRKLKGIGEYTAGAILSMAYGLPETAVDGNVLRIFARLYCLEDDILTPVVKNRVTAMVQRLQPPDAPGTFNEALMDLGATVCIPKVPRCEECPLTGVCQAHAAGRERELPLRVTNKDVPVEARVVAVVCADGQLLLHQRPDKGLLAGMWEFPQAESRDALRQLLAAQGLVVRLSRAPVTRIRHVFTHKIWELTVYRATLPPDSRQTWQSADRWQWVDADTATREVLWAGPNAKVMAAVEVT